MSRKISVYVDDDLHRSLKSAASLRGVTLSEFMVDAARQALYAPSRKEAAARMDLVRDSLSSTYSSDEIRTLREEGRRVWPRK